VFALSVESAGPSLKRTLLRAWLVLLGGTATYLLFFTASYFHTTAENLVGLLIAQGCVMAPLMLITQDYFTSTKWLRLSNFVLPPDDLKRDS
jgi:glucose-6-phosphate-specific signal transduction histidine kinase